MPGPNMTDNFGSPTCCDDDDSWRACLGSGVGGNDMTSSPLAFAGQTAVVTGASSGLGRTLATAFAAAGANVALIGRKVEALETAAAMVRRLGVKASTYVSDLSDDGSIRALVERLAQELPSVDILAHAAGVIARATIASARVEDLDRQYATNLRAPYVLTQALLPRLRHDHGQIVLLNSTAGLRAIATLGQYAATKHALRALADSLRDEVNGDGVRVLSVFVGSTATPMQAALHAEADQPYAPERLLQPGDVAAIIVSALSLPRTAEVTELSIRPMLKPL